MAKNTLKNKGKSLKLTTLGFTLVELLAVIVILAIIALIATPIILGTINDSKERATELSVKNYIRAVELAISNKYVKDPTINLDGQCEIVKETNGKKIKCGTNVPIPVEYEGSGLIEGTITLKKGEVTRLNKGKIDEKYVMYNNDKITLFDGISTLVSGQDFNKKIKQLLDSSNESITQATEDTTITSIEFYSNGKLPKGYTKAKLQALSSKVDVSLNGDGSIMAYFDNGKVYVLSDNLISFNQDSNTMFSNFKALTEIKFGIIDTSKVEYMQFMFSGCKALETLDLSEFDTSNIKNMSYMFINCNNLISLDLSGFNTLRVENMSNMFQNCILLTKLDLSSFKTHNVNNMRFMFAGNTNLENLNISNFNTTNVENMEHMFNGCKALETLDLSSFNTNKVSNMKNIFQATSSLSTIKIGCEWETSTNNTDMFTNSKYTLHQFDALVEKIQSSCPVTQITN